MTDISGIVDLERWFGTYWGLDIKTKSGKIYTFRLCNPSDGRKNNAAAKTLLEKRIAATRAK